METDRIGRYAELTREYLASPDGCIGMANCRALGYSHMHALIAAVMTATRVRKHETIEKVVGRIA